MDWQTIIFVLLIVGAWLTVRMIIGGLDTGRLRRAVADREAADVDSAATSSTPAHTGGFTPGPGKCLTARWRAFGPSRWQYPDARLYDVRWHDADGRLLEQNAAVRITGRVIWVGDVRVIVATPTDAGVGAFSRRLREE